MGIFDLSLGVDFKRDQLILTLLKKSFGKIRLIDWGIHPLLPESQKEEREAQAISLINSFISKHQASRDRVSIAIPREKVIARFLRLPIATKENLRKVLEYEATKYAPFDKGEMFFDHQILREEKEWVHLFAVFVKKADVDTYLSLLKKIGIQPLSIQIPSTAALNLFFYNEEVREDEVSVLLELSGPFFEMNLIEGKNWRESFRLPLPPEKEETKIINTFKRSGLEGDFPAKSTFYLYGAGVNDAILTSLKETNQIKGVASPPMNRLEAAKGLPQPGKIYSSIGLPLKGLTQLRVDLNLLPLEMRRKVRQIGKPLFVTFLAVVLALCLSWGTGAFLRYQNELDVVRAEVNKRRPEVEAVKKLQKQKEELKGEITELEKITSGEVSKIDILREMTQILPSTVWIWNFKYTGKEIEISGFADSASDLIPLLDRSPLFEKVEFLAPVTKERERRMGADKEKERFKIKMRLEGKKGTS